MGETNDSEEFFDALDDTVIRCFALSSLKLQGGTVCIAAKTATGATAGTFDGVKEPDRSADKSKSCSQPSSPSTQFPTTSDADSIEQSVVVRRRKLDELRVQLQQDLNERAEFFNSSESDLSSLASWGKLLLNTWPTKKSQQVASIVTVVPLDSVSTRGGASPADNDANTATAMNLATTVHDADSQAVGAQTNDSSAKLSGPSTGSSKASTLERFETPESHSSSLEKDLRLSRSSLAAKTGSLTRDFTADQLLLDEAHLADIERKNSEAAQVIEALTSEIVKNVKLDQRSPNGVASGKTPLTETISSDAPIDEVLREPDIVASNRIKMAASLTASTSNRMSTSIPVRPPRKKKFQVQGVVDVRPATPSKAVENVTLQRSCVDEALLDTVMVKNLDTGEQIPLRFAEEKIPRGINPLCLHIMRLTNDYLSDQKGAESDSESMASDDTGSVHKLTLRDNYFLHAKEKTRKYRKILGKKVECAVQKTIGKMKHLAEVAHQKVRDESSQSEDEENSENGRIIQLKASHHHKGPFYFDQIRLVQDLRGEHTGAVWCAKFSLCGRLLATAGQDNLIRIWVLKDAYKYFDGMRRKYCSENENFDSLTVTRGDSTANFPRDCSEDDLSSVLEQRQTPTSPFFAEQDDVWAPFKPKPFCCYRGHTADVLDVSWSKNYFILSSSMDRTVRLWHLSRLECLCCFQHIDFVTAIAFLPKDDRYFLSGSLDGKLRLWHIPEKKVALWNEVDGGKLITALTFARNGKFVVVGTYDGRCNFYSTDQLKYHTQIDINSNRMKTSRSRKITGLQSYQDKLLVTSNDSRIRLYDLRDLSLSCKYKGYTNNNSQIRASFNHNGKFIITGSEDKHIYLWKTHLNSDTLSLSVRKDQNRQWESIRAHNAVVTAAVFAPKPEIIFDYIERCRSRHSNADVASLAPSDSYVFSSRSLRLLNSSVEANMGEVLVSADLLGTIYVFLNKSKVSAGSSTFLPSY